MKNETLIRFLGCAVVVMLASTSAAVQIATKSDATAMSEKASLVDVQDAQKQCFAGDIFKAMALDIDPAQNGSLQRLTRINWL
jgi:hypothetical protein